MPSPRPKFLPADRLTHDRRYFRASQMTAWVLQQLGPLLCDDPRQEAHRRASQKLMEMFYDSGVELLTDEDRKAAHLPPRGPLGWTDYELQTLEAHRLQAMYATLPPIIITGHGSAGFVAKKDDNLG